MNLVLYDFLQVAGGAERVSLLLARHLRQGKLVVSRVYPEAAPLLETPGAEIIALGGKLSRLLGRIPEAILLFGFPSRRLVERGQTVIYSGFYAPFAVQHQRSGKRIYYCHTLPRFAYDLYPYYRQRMPFGSRWVYTLGAAWIRHRYRKAMRQMDIVVANSQNIQRRLAHFLDIDAQVIHPPVDTQSYRHEGDGSYYLSLARLAPYKRVELIVEAFKHLPEKQLIVASGGVEEARLKALAAGHDNISFTGWLPDARLRSLVCNARASIYIPQDEDFGMSPVESMAAGKPVIGAASGGLLETIVTGETGLLIEEPVSPKAIIQAIEQLEQIGPEGLRQACEQRAELFSEHRFLHRMALLTDQIVAEQRAAPSI